MAIRTRTELHSDFADNATGDIKAQNHRDFVDSILVYGEMNASDILAFATTTTPVKLPFSASSFAYGMVADIANDEFDNVEEGHYRISLDIDASLTGNNVTYTIQLYADGLPVGAGFTYNTRDDSGRLARSFNVAGILPTDVAQLDIRISSTSAQTIDIWSLDWIMERMGSA